MAKRVRYSKIGKKLYGQGEHFYCPHCHFSLKGQRFCPRCHQEILYPGEPKKHFPNAESAQKIRKQPAIPHQSSFKIGKWYQYWWTWAGVILVALVFLMFSLDSLRPNTSSASTQVEAFKQNDLPVKNVEKLTVNDLNGKQKLAKTASQFDAYRSKGDWQQITVMTFSSDQDLKTAETYFKKRNQNTMNVKTRTATIPNKKMLLTSSELIPDKIFNKYKKIAKGN